MSERYFVVVSDFTDDEQTSTVPLSQLAADVGPHLIVTRGGVSTAVVLPLKGRVVIGRAKTADVALADPGLSREHVAIEVGEHVSLLDLGSSNGTVVGGRAIAPQTRTLLRPNDVIEIGTTLLLVQGLPREASEAVGRRARAFALGHRVAGTDLNVLVSGPAGAGKAHLVGLMRAGSTVPLHEVQCGRLTKDSLAALFERPPKAMLLRRVDATPQPLQGKLFNLTQAKGLRVFATSRVDLELSVRRLEFYAQLLAQLRQVHVDLPALSECGDEVEYLAAEIVVETATAMALRRSPTLTPAAVAALKGLHYPENARTLRSVVQGAVAAAADDAIDAVHIVPTGAPTPEDRERQRILDALAECGGNQTQAAKKLGMSRRTLVSRLDKYKIVRPRKPR